MPVVLFEEFGRQLRGGQNVAPIVINVLFRDDAVSFYDLFPVLYSESFAGTSQRVASVSECKR